jgi:hypothetical protein
MDQSDYFFSLGDLVVRPEQDLPDHLIELPRADWANFLFGLHYTVVAEQAVKTCCPQFYASFKALTGYPKLKVDRSIGWGRSMTEASPREIFWGEILESRDLAISEIDDLVGPWASFVEQDLSMVFLVGSFQGCDWEGAIHRVREAILTIARESGDDIGDEGFPRTPSSGIFGRQFHDRARAGQGARSNG